MTDEEEDVLMMYGPPVKAGDKIKCQICDGQGWRVSYGEVYVCYACDGTRLQAIKARNRKD